MILPPDEAGITAAIIAGERGGIDRKITKNYRDSVYIDNEVAGIPVDLRILGSHPTINWVADAQTEDNGIQNDKEMKNRGYLKGPITFRNTSETGLARDYDGDLRKVIATKYLSEGEHWLRFKNVNENDDGNAQFMHDYLEIVPMTFLRDETLSLDEKRK